MAITKEETILAIKISQTIQDHFNVNKNIGTLKPADIYEVLYKKGIENWDRNTIGRFKDFLKKLENNRALNLIPQCRAEMVGKATTWCFESTPGRTIKARNLVPLVRTENKAVVEPVLA
jgi:hypothetical protein